MSQHPEMEDAERIRVSLKGLDGGKRALLSMTLRETTLTVEFSTESSRQADADFNYMVNNVNSILDAALAEAEAQTLEESAE